MPTPEPGVPWTGGVDDMTADIAARNDAADAEAGGVSEAEVEAAVDTAVASLVDSSPASLDTLNELAAAMGDDPNFATTLTNALGAKASTASLTAHIDDPTDAHDATAISYAGGTGMSATNVEAAIDELATEKTDKATFPVCIGVALSDETTAITTGNAKATIRAPFAFTLTAVRASLTTVSSSGLPTVDINEAGSTILSTKLTIDANEKTSTTAATPAVISDSAIADDAELTFDIDVAGTGATGLKVWLIGTRVLP